MQERRQRPQPFADVTVEDHSRLARESLGECDVELAEAEGEHGAPQRALERDAAAAVVVVLRLRCVARKRLLDLGAVRPHYHPRLGTRRLDAEIDAGLANAGRGAAAAEL